MDILSGLGDSLSNFFNRAADNFERGIDRGVENSFSRFFNNIASGITGDRTFGHEASRSVHNVFRDRPATDQGQMDRMVNRTMQNIGNWFRGPGR